MFKGIGTTEIIIIAVVLFIFFGGNKFTKFARDIGKSTKELKKVKKEAEDALTNAPLETKKEKRVINEPEGGVN